MDTENRPVLTGLIALVGVAVVIGLLGGLAVMIGVKAAGIGDSSSASDDSAPATFNLPKPSDTSTEQPAPSDTGEPSPTDGTSSATPAEGISLSATQQSVAPMQQIDLTGTYQAGEGAILQVQRFENGRWTDFPVTVPVSGGTFTTYLLTSRTGPNKFRVIDSDTDVTSNEVTVTVG